MSKKSKKNTKDSNFNKEEIVGDYYGLKSDAVADLVKAQNDAIAQEEIVSSNEITVEVKKYRKGFLSKVPVWIKALFVKFWFNGMICFFFYWGLGAYIADQLDLIVVVGLAMGVLTDILLNNILRFMNGDKKEYDAYMMLPMKKFWTFFVNIVYAGIVLFCVIMTYQLINIWVIKANELPLDSVPLGVEPLLFGVFYLFYDMIFITVKNVIVGAVKKHK